MSTDAAARIQATTDALMQAAATLDSPPTIDGRVSERAAELLTGYAPGSFKGLRELGVAPACYRLPAGGGRLSYRVCDLAEWIESKREDPAL